MRHSLTSYLSVILWISSFYIGRAQTEYLENRIPLGGFVDTGSIPSGYYSVDAYNGNLYLQSVPGLDANALASSINDNGVFYPARTQGSNSSSDAYVFVPNTANTGIYSVSIPAIQTGITDYLPMPNMSLFDEYFYSENNDNIVAISADSINSFDYPNQGQLLPAGPSIPLACFDPTSVRTTAYSQSKDKAYFYYYDTATLGSVTNPYLGSLDVNQLVTNQRAISNPMYFTHAEMFYHDSVDRLIGIGQKATGEVVIFSMDTLGNQILEYNVPAFASAPTVISIPKNTAALSEEDNILYFQLVTNLGQLNEQATLYSYRLEDVNVRKLTAHDLPATIKHLHSTPTIDGLVFAGDVNRDGGVNFVDFLSFAPSFSVAGAPRSPLDQNINWVGYSSPDWLDTAITSINLKNADCNGNGIIDSADVLAFLQNYRAVHNSEKSASGQQNCPYEFYFVMPDSAFFGDSVTIGIGLDLPLQAASGMALELDLDTSTLVNEGSLAATFPTSWFGEEGLSTLSIQRREPLEGQLDFALSQNTTNQVSGSGVFAEIVIVTPDEVVKKASSQELLIPLGFQETYIQFINGAFESGCFLPDTLRVVEKQSVTALSDIDRPSIQVHPNPSDNVWQINASRPWTKLEVVNSLGQVVYQEATSHSMASIPTEATSNEFSVLILYYPTTIETLPLLKLHK